VCRTDLSSMYQTSFSCKRLGKAQAESGQSPSAQKKQRCSYADVSEMYAPIELRLLLRCRELHERQRHSQKGGRRKSKSHQSPITANSAIRFRSTVSSTTNRSNSLHCSTSTHATRCLHTGGAASPNERAPQSNISALLSLE
jgi:hypothetical protein